MKSGMKSVLCSFNYILKVLPLTETRSFPSLNCFCTHISIQLEIQSETHPRSIDLVVPWPYLKVGLISDTLL